MAGSVIDNALGAFARFSERIAVWHKWPFIPAIAIILGHRANLRGNNLTDTETVAADRPEKPDGPENFDVVGWRTPDGTFNDLGKPSMGAKGMRFGRNMPLGETFAPDEHELMDPSPRLVSEKLMARREFVPVPHLNVLAAAWIQFMVHDWLSHGKNDKAKMFKVPLPEGDDWPGGEMNVPRTMPDPQTYPADEGRPDTWRNVETSWWDGSQIYGSDWDRQKQIRTGSTGTEPTDAYIKLDDKGLLPVDELITKNDEVMGHELTGVNANWWSGLSVLHVLFSREHNAIVDRLRIDHPQESEEWLFQKARLVNAALMAKIHTVEWTPALMDSPEGRMAMRGNYWGLGGESVFNSIGRLSDSEVISGIPGSPQDHHGIAYAMTEEFGAVYRLHSLMPDTYSFRSFVDDSPLQEASLTDISSVGSARLYDSMSFDDVAYSLGTSNPGALVLHNFPETLRRIDKKAESGIFMDLAAVDVLRDRERGIPRYKEFRRLIGARAPESFADITDNRDWQRELQEVYGTVDKVDLLVGTLAEAASSNGTPPRFGFSDTAFRIFILMASRRLKSDRFFTDDFRPEVYTEAGFKWVAETSFTDVVRRHCPALAPALADARNPFFPWAKAER